MPGPFVTPPAQRHLFHNNSAFHMTPPTRRLDITTARLGMSLGGVGTSGTSRTGSPIPGIGRFGSVISVHSNELNSVGGVGGVVSSLQQYGSQRFGELIRNSPKPHSSPKMKLRSAFRNV